MKTSQFCYFFFKFHFNLKMLATGSCRNVCIATTCREITDKKQAARYGYGNKKCPTNKKKHVIIIHV